MHQNKTKPTPSKTPDLLFLSPVFKSMIWGGHRLSKIYHLKDQHSIIAEAWVVSAHPEGDCLIDHPDYQGKTLSWLYATHPELFNHHPSPTFPLLIKFIDAKADLSLQVHPDDEYALKHENSYGKTEAWIILDAQSDSQLIVGHRAQNKEQLDQSIQNGTINALALRHLVKKGDFFTISSKTLHAIGKGIFLYEVQQNTAITYRVDDYGRTDAQGKPRQLHLKQAMDVLRSPDVPQKQEPLIHSENHLVVTIYPDNAYFKMIRLDVQANAVFELHDDFALIGCIEGSGTVNGHSMAFGQHALIPYGITQLEMTGKLSLVLSIPHTQI